MIRIAKWTALALALAVGALFLAFGTSAGSYASTAFGLGRKHIAAEVPTDFELARAEDLVLAIEPEVERCKYELARAEVHSENLERQITELGEQVAGGRERLGRGVDLLDGGEFSLASATAGLAPARERIALDLERRFEALENDAALLDAKQQLLERQRAAVEAARERLLAVSAERDRLLADIEHLRTQKLILDAAAATSPNLALDDSSLGEARRAVAAVRERLDVMQKLLEQDVFFAAGGEDRSVDVDELAAEIREYLGREGAHGD